MHTEDAGDPRRALHVSLTTAEVFHAANEALCQGVSIVAECKARYSAKQTIFDDEFIARMRDVEMQVTAALINLAAQLAAIRQLAFSQQTSQTANGPPVPQVICLQLMRCLRIVRDYIASAAAGLPDDSPN